MRLTPGRESRSATAMGGAAWRFGGGPRTHVRQGCFILMTVASTPFSASLDRMRFMSSRRA
jgi:hypothetical protein